MVLSSRGSLGAVLAVLVVFLHADLHVLAAKNAHQCEYGEVLETRKVTCMGRSSGHSTCDPGYVDGRVLEVLEDCIYRCTIDQNLNVVSQSGEVCTGTALVCVKQEVGHHYDDLSICLNLLMGLHKTQGSSESHEKFGNRMMFPGDTGLGLTADNYNTQDSYEK